MIDTQQGASIRKRTIERRLALIVGGIAILANAAAAVHFWGVAGSPPLELAARMASVIDLSAIAALAIIIATFGTRTAGAVMLAISMAFASTNDSLALLQSTFGFDSELWLRILSAATGGPAAAAFVRASQLFPKRLTTSDLAESRSAPLRRTGVRRILDAMLRPWVGWVIGAIWAIAMQFSDDLLPSLVVVVIGATFFGIQWQIGSRIARRRVAWLVQGVLVFALLIVADTLFGLLAGPQSPEVHWWKVIVYDSTATILGMGCFAMAIFAAGAFNSALIVRATVAWTAAVAVLLFVINVLTSAAVDQLSAWLGISDRLIAATLGTGAGLVLSPLAKRLNDWARRRTATA